MRRTALISYILVMLFCLSSGVTAQNLIKRGFGSKHRTLVGFKGGIINQTDYHAVPVSDTLKEYKDRTRIGLSFQIFFDIPVGSKLFSTLSFEMQDIHVVAERHEMLDVSLYLKYAIYKEAKKLAWRPFVGIGWAYLGDGAHLEKSSFTTLKVGLEGVFYTHRRYAYMGEIMVYGSIDGGNDAYDVTFGPVVLFRLGVLY